MQGFFLAFALWLQAGEHFSPPKAGLTAVAFNGHSFEAALVHTAPYAMGAFALCAVAALLLPRTAVSEEALTES
jgi:hypothetical protein